MPCVHVLEVLVALVEAVLLAVLGERLDVAVVVGSGLVDSSRGPVVVVVLVDVVAEAEDEVKVLLLSERRVGRVVAGLVALARVEADPELLIGVRGGKRAEGPDTRFRVLGLKAVVVLARRGEAADPGMHREVPARLCEDVVPVDDMPKAGIGRDLHAEARGAVQSLEARPQRDGPLGRDARGDPVGELGSRGWRECACPRQPCEVDRACQRKPGAGARDQELPSPKPTSHLEGFVRHQLLLGSISMLIKRPRAWFRSQESIPSGRGSPRA